MVTRRLLSEIGLREQISGGNTYRVGSLAGGGDPSTRPQNHALPTYESDKLSQKIVTLPDANHDRRQQRRTYSCRLFSPRTVRRRH